MDLYTKLEMFYLVEYVPSDCLREMSGFHDNFSLQFPLIVSTHASLKLCRKDNDGHYG